MGPRMYELPRRDGRYGEDGIMTDLVLTPSDGTNNRFTEFRTWIERAYEWKWHLQCPWGPAEANQLSNLLKACPKLDSITFAHWLKNYLDSDDHPPGERPSRFLPRLHNYSVTPLDRFGRNPDAKTETAYEQKQRRINADFERARQNRLEPQRSAENLPLEGSRGTRRVRALASGLRPLSDCGD